MRAAALTSLVLFAGACVSPPRPAPVTLGLQRNTKAAVEGRVVDVHGSPVAGLRVDAIPHGAAIPWSLPAMTGSDGRFRLDLYAPGEYSFALRQGERTIVTDDRRDPSRVHVTVAPGMHVDGVELLFLEEKWKAILGGGAR